MLKLILLAVIAATAQDETIAQALDRAGNVIESDTGGDASDGSLLLPLLGAAAGWVWAQFRSYQGWFGAVAGGIVGLIAHLMLT